MTPSRKSSISKRSHIERGFEMKKYLYTSPVQSNKKKGFFYQRKSITSFKNQLSQGEFFINTNTEEKSLRALTLITLHANKLVNKEALAKGLF